MTKLEAILRQASSLSPDERARLIEVLCGQADLQADADQAAVGERGLAAWTASTRDESWTEFYPDTLRDGRGKSA